MLLEASRRDGQLPADGASPAPDSEVTLPEAYGFALWAAATVGFVAYHAWMWLPAAWLRAAGLGSLVDARYWGLAGPAGLIVVVCSYTLVYGALSLYANPPVHSLATVRDGASRPAPGEDDDDDDSSHGGAGGGGYEWSAPAAGDMPPMVACARAFGAPRSRAGLSVAGGAAPAAAGDATEGGFNHWVARALSVQGP